MNLVISLSVLACVLLSIPPSEGESVMISIIRRAKRQAFGLCERESIKCVHGHCEEKVDKKVLECVCDKNYVGPTCDQKCVKDCGQHGTCIVNSRGEELCSCDEGFTGTQCGILLRNRLSLSKDTIQTIPRSIFSSLTNRISMFNSVFIPKSKTKREGKEQGSISYCGGGWKCYNHGECQYGVSANGNKRFSCKCKPGLLPPFCQQKCNKICKNGGMCLIDKSSKKMLCGCRWPFSGDDCGKLRYRGTKWTLK